MTKATLRKSALLSKQEYVTIVGLLALAANHNRRLKEIEQAVLSITKECDHNGKEYEVYGGGHSGDAVYSTDPDPSDLLKRLGLRVRQ